MSEHNFEAWCNQHECPPEDCWLAHNPHAVRMQGAETSEQAKQRVAQKHLVMQEGAKNAKHSDQA